MRHSFQTSRRGFFASPLKQITDNAADKVLEAVDLKAPLAFLGLNRTYVRMRREIMATYFEILFGSYEDVIAREIAMEMLDEVERFDFLMNIWRGSSELKEVNQRASYEDVPVCDEIFRMVKLAQKFYYDTDGAYDITATALARCWGFFGRRCKIPTEDELTSAMKKTGMQYVELNEKRRTIKFHKFGIELTPASIGKGMALDYALRIGRKRGLNNVLLNGGFSSVLASGSPAWKDAWTINIRDPFDHENPVARLHLLNKGFSSSGSEEQFFIHNGKRYGHIVDPRTGWPSSEILSVNVVAPSAALAEVLSTAFCVMGVEKTLKYCENHKKVGVIILPMPDDNGCSEVITTNLSEDCLEVLKTSCLTKNRAII